VELIIKMITIIFHLIHYLHHVVMYQIVGMISILTKKNNSSNNTVSLIHTNGCYSVIEKFITIELWTLIGITGLCALLQILAITLMCILNQRYKKLDDNPKFAIDQLASGVPINGNGNNNMQGSSKTIEETVEITQI